MVAPRLLIALIGFTLLTSSAACNSDEGYAPTAPGSLAAPQPPRPADSTATGVLVFSDVTVVHGVDRAGTAFSEPWATLREVSGTVGVSIISLQIVYGPHGSVLFRADGCMHATRRVPPGGTWTFEQITYYCREPSDNPPSAFEVVVTYEDDNGHFGTARGSWQP